VGRQTARLIPSKALNLDGMANDDFEDSGVSLTGDNSYKETMR
jgi:hypothetical protein